MASTRRHAAATPSTQPRESLANEWRRRRDGIHPAQVLYISGRDGPGEDRANGIVSTNGQGALRRAGPRIGSGASLDPGPLAARVLALVRARRHGLPREPGVAPRSAEPGSDGEKDRSKEKSKDKNAEDAVGGRRRYYL